MSIDDDEEYMANGIFVFNISKMIAHININPNAYEKRRISVNAYRRSDSNLDETYIQIADLTTPIILAEIRPGAYNAIDGRHRLEKAYRNGVPELEAYFLPPEQHMPFLTTQKEYEAYIQYWNAKVDEDNGIFG